MSYLTDLTNNNIDLEEFYLYKEHINLINKSKETFYD